MHNLIVRQGQHEVLAKCVDQAEGDGIVMELAVDRVVFKKVERIVHPTHHPLLTEAQAAGISRAGYPRPGSRFLGDGDGIREFTINRLIKFFQESRGFQVFIAAKFVGYPLPLLAGIVQVEHGGHGIDAQAIRMVAVQPEEGIGDKERTHLVAVVVEDAAFPIGMEAQARVGMVVEMRTIKIGQAVGIGREVGGHPVQDDADACLMQGIH